MAFLKNAWYVAAWADELKAGELFQRTILGEPVLFYRQQDGATVAIGNRCPHRFAPLHLGKLRGDQVECGYHGLQFDSQGQCVHNPHGQGVLPRAAQVKSYPIVEKHRAVWIWMGEPQKADAALIPNYSFLTDSPQTAVVTMYIPTACHYELLVDNIMDLTHALYLHSGSLGSEAITRSPAKVWEEGGGLQCNWWCTNAVAPPAFDQHLPRPGELADHWLEVRWDAPALLCLRAGATLMGQPREEGVDSLNCHLMTPETETTTHYFYGGVRTFNQHDGLFNERLRGFLEYAFAREDKPMIEAQQKSMGSSEFWTLKPVLLSIDTGPVRVRRVLEKLIKDEQQRGRD
jgi:phenylpropionate dioxygenase-like ring-hydroxylating dioxygenase large terminal subunit